MDNPDPPVTDNQDPPVADNPDPPVIVLDNPDPPAIVLNNPDLPVQNHQHVPVNDNNVQTDNPIEQPLENLIGIGADIVPDGAGETLNNIVVEDDILPRDSISQVKSNVRSTASSSLSKIKYKEKKREIELQNELKNLVEKNRMEDERHVIESRLQVEKAEEEIRQASERAVRLRRHQELQDRLREIARKEEQLKIQSQLSVAAELNRIYVDSEISFKPQHSKAAMVTEPKVTIKPNIGIPVNNQYDSSTDNIQSVNPVRVPCESVVNIQSKSTNNPTSSEENQITSILNRTTA
ncbi:hypothetical protein LOTGIDRAFT_170834 [Lottia gigantea]|uniref:Uncharacterized protein n=1 Tax=Lottia gigantea TaxID=225164 RepID=V4BAE5_LOTGI|nr:hypothetical protein LOTGIDRAFT_170834 [Lottia gigantea]ESP04441.1 hypothetical protein LOTGIDRAFT_170834 [Lottia gigantea]